MYESLLVSLKKIHYTKGVITRIKCVKNAIKGAKEETEMRYNANKGKITPIKVK